MPVLGVLEAFLDLVPTPRVAFASTSRIGHYTGVCHEFLALRKPPDLVGSAHKHEEDKAHTDRSTTEEKVNDAPGGHSTVLLSIEGNVVDAYTENDGEQLI